MTRDEAIEELKQHYRVMSQCLTKEDCLKNNEALDMAIKALEEQEKRRWIPVSERLPDSPKQVLVYARSVHYALAKYDEMREADGSYKKQWVTFDAWKPFYTIKEVLAWMPLPEPYQGVKYEG